MRQESAPLVPSQAMTKSSPSSLPIVVAMTGASGAVYGVRLLDRLLASGKTVHFTLSPAAVEVLRAELAIDVDLSRFQPQALFASARYRQFMGDEHREVAESSLADLLTRFRYFHYQDFGAGMASGSFRTLGMVICPCSMGTLSSLAHGQSSNLIQRAADVHLKERRKLIVVPRETPLGTIALRNMATLSEAGAVILPAMPGFYHTPTAISNLVDFVVGRICDQLGVEQDLMPRWGRQESNE